MAAYSFNINSRQFLMPGAWIIFPLIFPADVVQVDRFAHSVIDNALGLLIPSLEAMDEVSLLYNILASRYEQENALRETAEIAAKMENRSDAVGRREGDNKTAQLVREVEKYAEETAGTWNRLRAGESIKVPNGETRTFPHLVSQTSSPENALQRVLSRKPGL
jgi:hypothetical protein